MPADIGSAFEHDENRQAFEQDGKILVALVDTTYSSSDESTWRDDRERFRIELERDFDLRFEDGNIGPGADFPAFLTLLETKASVPVWTLIASAFFLGKPILKNFEAWITIATKIRDFKRRLFLNRQGGAALAVQAIVEAIDRRPAQLQLLSYRTQQVYEPADLEAMERASEIADVLPTLHLGFVRHIFEIEADGEVFRVGVDGTEVQLLKLPD